MASHPSPIRLRQPLAEVVIAIPDPATLAPLAAIIAAELNVKAVRVLDVTDPAAAPFGPTETLTVNARAAGPRLGRAVQDVITAARDGDWTRTADGTARVGGVRLHPGEFEVRASAGPGDDRWAVAALPGGGFVALDTALTPALEAEGLARDLAAGIQQARKDARLGLTQDVAVHITGPAPVLAAATAHADLIRAATRTRELSLHPGPDARTTVRVSRS